MIQQDFIGLRINEVNGFLVLVSLYKQSLARYKHFVTHEDEMLLELLTSIDPEVIMGQKDIMHKFETSYRFFRSLV